MASKNEEKLMDRAGFIFDHNNGRLNDFYDVDNKTTLGVGTYGSVSKAINRSTGAPRAVKTMSKKDIKNEARYKAEINIMKKLDHPNIIRLFETFEDKKCTYLVLELCTGGELFDRIIENGFFSEKAACTLMKQILMAMHYCHNNHVMHRDLKPENFLFQNKSPDAPLKVIDFGLATIFEKNPEAKTKAGTPYYVSPQVLKGKYTHKCDMWSCGVMMYIIICGYPPFFGDTDNEILQKVKLGTYDFPAEDWSQISSEAKQLIKAMLEMDEAKRISAEDALSHSWISRAPAYDKPLSANVLSNFRRFRDHTRMKQIALAAIAHQLPESEIQALKETFLAIDKNGDGILTREELAEAMKSNKGLVLPDDFDKIFDTMDTDKGGKIDYTEFISAAMDASLYTQENQCWSAFRILDKDGDGQITKEELAAVVQSLEGSDDTGNRKLMDGLKRAQELILEADTDGDGQISFEEFMEMMKK